jgi:hypothetical protein
MNPTAEQLRCSVPAPRRAAAAGYAGRYVPLAIAVQIWQHYD